MRKFTPTGCLIAALAAWLGLCTAAVTVVALLGAGPRAWAVILMALGLMWWHYPLADLLPGLFAIPAAIRIQFIHPISHPSLPTRSKIGQIHSE